MDLKTIEKYLKDAQKLAKLDSAHQASTAELRSRVVGVEDAMKEDVKAHFDIDLSAGYGRVVLSEDFKVYPRRLGLSLDKNSFNFNYRKAVKGKISLRQESITKPHFRISFYS